MATHSSVLAWRIARTAEPGGLPSMGLHRVGHDWRDSAAAAAAAKHLVSHLCDKIGFMSNLNIIFSSLNCEEKSSNEKENKTFSFHVYLFEMIKHKSHIALRQHVNYAFSLQDQYGHLSLNSRSKGKYQQHRTFHLNFLLDLLYQNLHFNNPPSGL